MIQDNQNNSSEVQKKEEITEDKSFSSDELKKQAWKERRASTHKKIDEWNVRAKKETPLVKFEQVSQEGKKVTVKREITCKDKKTLTPTQEYELMNSEMLAATGSISTEFSNMLLSSTLNTLFESSAYSRVDSVNAVYSELIALNPRDSYEGMIITRMIALHHQYMHLMGMSAQASNQDARDKVINSATKLMRVYNESLEALNKHRRKGEQRVTVTHNHVNVNEGGKAIVSSQINQAGGGV